MAGLLVKKEELMVRRNVVVGKLLSVEVVKDTAYGYYSANGEIVVLKSSESCFSSILIPKKFGVIIGLEDSSVINVEAVEGFMGKVSSKFTHFFPESICFEFKRYPLSSNTIDSITISQLLGRGCVSDSELVELELMEIATVKGINVEDDFVMTERYFELVKEQEFILNLSSL